MQTAFWICFGLLAYVYAGYPLLAWLLGCVFARPVHRGPVNERVSVVISVYNEAAFIEKKIRHLLDDHGDCVEEIHVASDGSTDGTDAIIERLASKEPRVKAHVASERRGKPFRLNETIPLCASEFVLLLDARQTLEAGSIPSLLENMHDERVGVVTGELIIGKEDGGFSGGYWSVEKWIRRNESRFHSIPGATGACCLVRRALFEAIPEDSLLDDVEIPMRIIRKGYRCVMDSRAVIRDRAVSPRMEMRRKRRTIAGNLQCLIRHPRWIVPGGHPVWFSFFSHKILRLVLPFATLGLWLMSAGLFEHGVVYPFAFLGISLAVVLGLAGWVGRNAGWRFSLIRLCFAWFWLNLSTVLAIVDTCRGRWKATWK